MISDHETSEVAEKGRRRAHAAGKQKGCKADMQRFVDLLTKKFFAKGAICTALSFVAHELFSLARCLRRRANEKGDNEQPRKFQGGLMKTG